MPSIKIEIDVQFRKGWYVVCKNGVPTHQTSQQIVWANEKAETMANRIAKRDGYSIRKIKDGCFDLTKSV